MSGDHIREHLLQQIWEKQYVRGDQLVTSDGRDVEVVDPGQVSLEPGPDIRKARIRIDGTLFSGTVEIHRNAPEWRIHGHHTDPQYNSVILHVLLFRPPDGFLTHNQLGRAIPMVSLVDVLIRPLEELRRDALFDERDLRSGRIPCSGQNECVPASVLIALLDRLAMERIEIKLRRSEERMHELIRASERAVREHQHPWDASSEDPHDIPPPHGEIPHVKFSRQDLWEQVLYEGFMEGLGYARNRQPFMKLCRIVTLQRVRDLRPDHVQIESLLFGAAGLLPSSMSEADVESRMYVHALQQAWHTLKPRFGPETLSPHEWIMSSGRPANSPYLRLIAARELIRKFTDEGLFLHILRIVKRGENDVRRQLHSVLAIDPDPFWDRRVSFFHIIPGIIQPLGETRMDDLIMNAVVPLLLLYARMFRDAQVRRTIVRLLGTFPALQHNTITRRIEEHVLRKKVGIKTALHHQGAMQLFNYYCKEGRCGECDVGRIVWE